MESLLRRRYGLGHPRDRQADRITVLPGRDSMAMVLRWRATTMLHPQLRDEQDVSAFANGCG
jgi:hypothetical protein